jgi:tetratricopeptide (TPR) repeat protein
MPAPHSATASRAWTWIALAGVLALAWLCYAPGLAGGFLFDDFVNHNELGRHGRIDDAAALARYLTNATGDPVGRPLSLLTFLIDARDWPADPWPFLRTNLCLHLLNGLLLFVLLRALGRQLGDSFADRAALLGSALWVLHPLFVSTTLYAVQREAMLPATFTLLGVLAYLRGRTLHADGQRWRGSAWIVAGAAGGTLLATLSKANGALLPLLLLVLEATVFAQAATLRADLARDRRLRLLLAVLLVVPALAIAAYLVHGLTLLDAPLPHRTWTLTQRLLTEPRVMVDYLALLAVPRSVSAGLFNDAYPVSTGLLSPPATLLSMLLLAGLLGLAAFGRRRWPALAAALLFYFAGHLLESTVIALELYFEHRNYLPALLLFWPLARWLARPGTRWKLRQAASVGLILLFAATLHTRAALWAKPLEQARLWARVAPESARAQSYASQMEVAAGQDEAAIERMRAAWKRHPDQLQLALNYANTVCERGGLDRDDVAGIAGSFADTSDNTTMVPRWLEKAKAVAVAHDCPGLQLADVDRWALAALGNPRIGTIPGRRQDLLSLRGAVALEEGRSGDALALFDRALEQDIRPDAAARQAARLGSKGYAALGLRHLDYYDTLAPRRRRAGPGMARVHEWVLERQGYWDNEFAALRRALQEDAAQRDGATPRR